MRHARALLRWLSVLLTAALIPAAAGGPATKPVDANRFAYLDSPCDPYYVGRNFPKLITPQWVGEEGVDAVVVLAIDDMRDTAKYEKWLRPVLNRLKQIDGRAPVSIMTCRADPKDPQLAAWLKEGLSIECHTWDHPCPLLRNTPMSTPATRPATRPRAQVAPAATDGRLVSTRSPDPTEVDAALNRARPFALAADGATHPAEPIRDPIVLPGEGGKVWVWDGRWRPDAAPRREPFVPPPIERASGRSSVEEFAAQVKDPLPPEIPPPPSINWLAIAKETYDQCVDVMSEIPGNKPVAFRTPCCDSRNTVSPRLFTEIIGQKTSKGRFLTIDSSVFNILTPNDPELPRELVLNPDGTERFRRYLPFKNFVNTIEDYPYPYVINGQTWEFPCVVPSDWEAQNIQKPFNPRTLEDWKANLDAIVIKKGVFTAVFHPHGWIKPEQVADFVDYAHKKYGKRVKFLNFRECQERLDKNLLIGRPIRRPDNGLDNGVRVVDFNGDGYMDVLIGNESVRQTRIYSTAVGDWIDFRFPASFANKGDRTGLKVGVIGPDGEPGIVQAYDTAVAWYFDGDRWGQYGTFFRGWGGNQRTANGFRLLDLDNDGRPELIDAEANSVFRWDQKSEAWVYVPDSLPVSRTLREPTYRFIDLNEDGKLDILISTTQGAAAYLQESLDKGWRIKLFDQIEAKTRGTFAPADFKPSFAPPSVRPADPKGRTVRVPGPNPPDADVPGPNPPGARVPAPDAPVAVGAPIEAPRLVAQVNAPEREGPQLPAFLTSRGGNNGAFVHGRALWWVNEETSGDPDLVFKVTFDELLGDQMPAGKTPQASLATIKPRPGFQVQLAAAEPLVQDPIAFAFGADGKLWVVEMGDYPLGVNGKGMPGGVVRYLEDKDGDGVYEKSTIFLAGISFPTGVTPWKKGVLITAAPDIFYAEDTNGDGHADVREVLFTGFGEGNQQHRLNGLVMGLDNWFYGGNGHSNGVIKSIKTGQSIDIRNRDFRIRPETGEIETATGPTQFGRNRDDWDNWFGNDNSHPFYQFALEDHYLRRNPHVAAPAGRMEVPDVPGPSPVFPISRTLTRFNDFSMANHFTSANSSMIYRDDLFGPAFSNSFFVSEPVHNLVSRQVMRVEGTRFHSSRAADEQDREFLASSDNWFRPTMLRTGPDGALWIADMYRLVIEHPQWIPKEWQEKLDLRAGHDMGRIYRVWPVGVKPRAMPRLDKMTGEQLAAAIDSPSGWQRDTAQQLLVERQDKSAVKALEKLTRFCPRPEARVQALCTLDGLKAAHPDLILATLKDPHPGVRRHAVRLCEPLMNRHPDIVAKTVASLAADPDSFVRLQVAYTLGEWKDAAAGDALAKLLVGSADDAILQTAAMSSLKPENLAAVLKAIGSDPAAVPSPTLVAALTRMALAVKDLQAVSVLAVSLVGPGKDAIEPSRFASVAALLDAVSAAYPSEKSVTRLLLTTGTPESRSACVRLDRVHERAERIALDERASDNDRVAALLLLGRSNYGARDREKVVKLLKPQVPGSVQAAAVAAIARSRDEAVPDILLAAWRGSTPAVRATILDTLLSRPAWATAMLNAIESGQIKVVDIDPARRQQMLKSKTAAIHDRAEKLFAAAINPDRQKVIDAMRAQVLAAKPDVKHGGEVFARTCVACHAVGGPAIAPGALATMPGVIGNSVGPDLASVGDKSPDGLLVAILDPNRAVEPRFISYVIETKAGDTLNGLLASESGNAITLLSADGKSQQILRSDIRELRSSGLSLMPEGLESGLQPQDIADLIAFVQQAKPPGRSP
jgi:putative membrane-bound dehydrogenase-like protein